MACVEYPKVMNHPGYHPAVIARPTIGKPLLPGEEPRDAHAAVFPPVTVHNEDQEGQHSALGYVAQAGDPSAHEPAAPQDDEPKQYPKWVGGRIVHSAAEERSNPKR